MIVFASGEGPTDIGKNSDSIGPMTKLIYFKLKGKGDIELEIIPRENLKNNGFLKLPGKKKNESSHYFFKNTYCLSNIIKKKLEGRENELLLVVFFRDSDTTDQKEWKDKYDSIVYGFKVGRCERGIPMLPKTSSEVWLLSSILKSHKIDGRALEEIRDREYLKAKLEEKTNNEKINDYNFNFSDISNQLSSYNKFEQDLNSVLST